jgi:hypothetical protein
MRYQDYKRFYQLRYNLSKRTEVVPRVPAEKLQKLDPIQLGSGAEYTFF